MELAMGRRPRYLLDPASLNPDQLASTPTTQDLLNEEFEKLAMRTHFEVEQREDIRRDLAERTKFFLPNFEKEKMCCCWQEDPSKILQERKSGKWLKDEFVAIKLLVAVTSTGSTISRQFPAT